MKTKIIIDSTCDFPEGLEHKKEEFDVLPANIYIDGVEYLDGIEIKIEDIFKAIEEKKTIKTAQVSLFRFRELFESLAEKGKDFIYLSFTSKHSGIYQTATMVVENLKVEYPDVKMAVIDTKGATVINGELALELDRQNSSGKSFEELVSFAENYAKHGEYNFVLKELDHLVRGGRISKIVSIAGGVLDIKPLMKLENGQLIIYKKIRTYKRAIKELMQICIDGIGSYKDKPIYVGYSADRDIALRLKEEFEKLNCTNVLLFQVGSGLASHLGMNGVGVLFMDENYYRGH